MFSTKSGVELYKEAVDRTARAVKGTKGEPVTDLIALGGASAAGAM